MRFAEEGTQQGEVRGNLQGGGNAAVLLPSKGENAVKNFDRQYRLAAGKAGSTGFEIGSGKRPLHISFSVEKADTNSQHTANVTI